MNEHTYTYMHTYMHSLSPTHHPTHTAASTPSSTLCSQCSPADLVALKCAALRALAATMGVTGKLETFKVWGIIVSRFGNC